MFGIQSWRQKGDRLSHAALELGLEPLWKQFWDSKTGLEMLLTTEWQ